MDIERLITNRNWTVEVLGRYSDWLGREYAQWEESWHPGSATEAEHMRVPSLMADLLSCASTVYWDPAIAAAATHGAVEAFTGTEFDLAMLGTLSPSQPQWWVIGEGVGCGPELSNYFSLTGDTSRFAALGILLTQSPLAGHSVHGLYLLVDREAFRLDAYDPAVFRVRSCVIIDNPPVPTTITWMAMLSFMRLPFVGVERHQLPRSDRRRAQREGREAPEINIVHLRRPEQSESSHPQQGREWQHQWIVRGHWRKQWYPSVESHKPVYVSPYMKGDPDKPLLSRPTIYKVVR